jgi:hypothetical protein
MTRITGDSIPLRIDAPKTRAWRGRHVAATLVVGAAALIAVQHFMSTPPHRQEVQAEPAAAAAKGSTVVHAPWSIVYERPEHCDANCTQVLETLNAVSRDPASGIPEGAAKVVVHTSAQPARDLIVLDSEGQPAGFISYTTDPGRVVSGLATLRASTPAASLASR